MTLARPRSRISRTPTSSGLLPRSRSSSARASSSETVAASQGYELRAAAPGGAVDAGFAEALKSSFHAAHQREYGRHFTEKEVELVNLRVVGVGRIPIVTPKTLPEGSETPDAPARTGARRVVFEVDGKPVPLEASVYLRAALKAGNRLAGPAVVQQMDTTTLIPPQVVATVDRHGNLIVRF